MSNFTMKIKKKQKLEFSKILLIQESILIWVMTIAFTILAFYCVSNQYFSELPWITAMSAFPWTAYGVSQAFYYKKSEKENTKNGIKYDTTLINMCAEQNEIQQKYQNILNAINENSPISTNMDEDNQVVG